MADSNNKDLQTAQGYLSTPPSDEEVKTVLQSIQDHKRQLAPMADTSELDKAEDQAKQLYQDRANRAEWMGVAERVGNALAKFGTAQAAQKAGVDVSRIQDLPPTDYEAKIDRYGKEYLGDLAGIERKRGRIQEQLKQNQANLDKQFQDENQAGKEAFDFAKYKYGQETDTYQQRLRDEANYQRELNRDALMSGRATARDKIQDSRANAALERQMVSKRVDDLQRQLKDEEEAKRNSAIAAQALASQDDISSKSVAKLEQTLPGVLGKAGLSPADLDTINEASKTRGWFGIESVDPVKRSQLIQDKVIGVHDKKIASLREALDKVLGSGSQTAGGAPAPAPQSTPEQQVQAATGSKGRVSAKQLQDYAGQHFSGNLDAARKFLTDQGFAVE